MQDEDLREQFNEWARPLRAAVPPPVSVIRRRARRRIARVAVCCVTAVAVLAAGGVLAAREIGGRQAPAASLQALSASPRLGQLPAPDAGAGAAPYYVAVSSDGSSAGVWDAATGKKLGMMAAPAEPSGRGVRDATIFTSIAAAGDDRTFVLGATASTNSEQARPVWLFELRLAAGGSPGPLQPLSLPRLQQDTVGHWYQSISSIALTADGTELAIATNRESGDQNGPSDIEVISLATGTARTWASTPPGHQLPVLGREQHPRLCLRRRVPARHHRTRPRTEPVPPPHPLVHHVPRPAGPAMAPCGATRPASISPPPAPGTPTGTVDNGHFTPGRNLPPQPPGTDSSGAGGDLIAW